MPDTIWKTYDPEQEHPGLHINIESLHLWLKRKGDELWVAHNYDKEGIDFNCPIDEIETDMIKWSRWALKSPESDLKLTPVFPNLPIIVSSEFPLKIAPNSRIQIVTRIPLWVQVSQEKTKYILTELPSSILSRTWFGNPLEGEICYWLTTKARRNFAELEYKPNLINCPILIVNKTNEDLNFEKFCFRVDHLGIFNANDSLWADETKIEYFGEDMNSDITMTGKLPENVGKGERISKARIPINKSFATRTFKKLFDDTFISAR